MEFTVTMKTFIFVSLSLASVLCTPLNRSPVHENADDDDTNTNNAQAQMMQTNFQSLEGVTHFLRKWFRQLSSRVNSQDRSGSRGKRSDNNGVVILDIHDTNETSFEDYERQFLLHQTINYLKQLYFSSKYQEDLKNQNAVTSLPGNPTQHPVTDATTHPTPDYNRIDAPLEAEINQLMNLPTEELERIFIHVQDVAQNGGGNTDITSICCPIG